MLQLSVNIVSDSILNASILYNVNLICETDCELLDIIIFTVGRN